MGLWVSDLLVVLNFCWFFIFLLLFFYFRCWFLVFTSFLVELKAAIMVVVVWWCRDGGCGLILGCGFGDCGLKRGRR